MYVYRLSNRRHATPLTGEGARLFGGRWNHVGVPALYATSTISLAALEYLAHVNSSEFPDDLVWLQIELPMKPSIEDMTSLGVVAETQSRVRGTSFLRMRQSLALRVTSVVLPLPQFESDLVLNPLHKDFNLVRVVDSGPFEFDSRFQQFLPPL